MFQHRAARAALTALTLTLVLAATGCVSPRLPADFANPVVPGLWTPDRMAGAAPAGTAVPGDLGADVDVTDPEPAPVAAKPEATSYHDNAAVVGKLFFDTDEGPSVCSATAVRDPARPGRSGLVWTAGHCVHGGAGGRWFRNIVFVPSYNNEGLTGAARARAAERAVAPFGTWWADRAETAPEWIAQGAASGGGGAPFDFAVLHVRRPGTGASLEETIGEAAPVWFGAASATTIPAMGAWGYPAEAPFDGERMFSCTDRPGRLAVRRGQPVLYRIGCTMTGGSSGGGWFARDPSGSVALVSNTSIGPEGSTWLAGPRLGERAREVYAAAGEAS
ncbi:trypsin-like serine peptidase [Streptomyces sp. NPDC059193]|uniref:trypsin-like serine peptidase n=1 Tax=Streptomyces sp. NPDC059193 TaxID=3346763 RepID=UPI0036CAE390